MKEYIERKMLLELYSNPDGLNIDNFRVPIEVIRQNIIDQPTADVLEVVHGKWTKMGDDMCYWYVCSHCGHDVPENRYHNDWFSDWCPNCGAAMVEIETD